MASMTGNTIYDPVRETHYEETVKEIVLNLCSSYACEIFLFGSRARGKARRSSDFDVGIRGLDLDAFNHVKRRIEDIVEDSPLPHSVDIVNFDCVPEPFRTIAMAERILWKSDCTPR